MIDREGLNKYIPTLLKRTANTSRKLSDVQMKAYKMFGMPFIRTKAILESKTGIQKATDEDLLWIVSAIYELYPVQNVLDKFYTVEEIEKYTGKSFNKTSLIFPLSIPAIQIEKDQYLAVIPMGRIVTLYQGNKLRYSLRDTDNTKAVSNGRETHLVPVVSSRKISLMVDYVQSNDYISEVITLNINPRNSVAYENGNLVINNVDKIDVVDNFAIFDALLKVAKNDVNYNKNIGFMITLFNNEREDMFIRQRKSINSHIDEEAKTLADQVIKNENYVFKNNRTKINPPTLQMGISAFFRNWEPKETIDAVLKGIRLFEDNHLFNENTMSKIMACDVMIALYCISLKLSDEEMISLYKRIFSVISEEDAREISYSKTPLNLQNLLIKISKRKGVRK